MKRKRLFALVMSLATVLLLIDFAPFKVMPDMQGTAITTRTAESEAPVVEEETAVTTLNDSEPVSETRYEVTKETDSMDVDVHKTVKETADAVDAEEKQLVKWELPAFENRMVYADLSEETQLEAIVNDKVAIVAKEPDNQTTVMEAEKNGRVLNYHGTEILVTDRDFEILCRIVEAEASIEDKLGKELVANVVLNRVVSDRYPNTIEGVVFDGGAFASTKNGRYSSVGVEDSTVEAVLAVLDGDDQSKGALYFMTKTAAESGRVKWLSTVEYLFRHQHHNFYK